MIPVVTVVIEPPVAISNDPPVSTVSWLIVMAVVTFTLIPAGILIWEELAEVGTVAGLQVAALFQSPLFSWATIVWAEPLKTAQKQHKTVAVNILNMGF